MENQTHSGAALPSHDLLCIASRYRNQPCPCGSGRKAKKCCATAEKWNAAKQTAFKAAEGKPRRRRVIPAMLAMASIGAMGDRRI